MVDVSTEAVKAFGKRDDSLVDAACPICVVGNRWGPDYECGFCGGDGTVSRRAAEKFSNQRSAIHSADKGETV